MRDVRGHFENFFCEIIDTIEQAAPARDENPSAEVIDERFFIEPSFEQLKSFTEAQMDDRVQGLALDLFPREAGIVL